MTLHISAAMDKCSPMVNILRQWLKVEEKCDIFANTQEIVTKLLFESSLVTTFLKALTNILFAIAQPSHRGEKTSFITRTRSCHNRCGSRVQGNLEKLRALPAWYWPETGFVEPRPLNTVLPFYILPSFEDEHFTFQHSSEL